MPSYSWYAPVFRRIHEILGSNILIPNSLTTPTRRELLLLSLFCALIFFRNFSLAVSGFGEQDAARIFNDAIVWHHLGVLPFSDYRPRIVPGYLFLTKELIDSGISIDNIIQSLNYINAFFGVLAVFLSYFFFKLFLPASLSIACVAIYSFVPSVFFSSIYGFPFLLAYTAFLISILLFVRSTIIAPSVSAPFWALTVLALSLATTVKADVILLSSVYFGLLIAFGRVSIATLTSAFILILFGIIAPITFKHFLLPSTAVDVSTASFLHGWNERFPLGLSNLGSRANVEIIIRSVGPIYFGLGFLGLIAASVRHKSRRLVWFVLIFTIPLTLFWGMRTGNSARHMMGLALPAILLIGILFQSLTAQRQARSALIVVTGLAIIMNYFSTSPRGDTVSPSSRLVESALLLQEHVTNEMKYGEDSIESRQPKYYLIDSYTLPYSLHNMLKHARSIDKWYSGSEENFLEITLLDGRQISLAWSNTKTREAAEQLAEQKRIAGFDVRSVEYPGL